jgi:Mg-chelatase subunit ChlI
MKVKYTDGPAAVNVAGVGRVERNHSVDVDKEQGERLLEQGWKKVGGSSSSGNGKGKKTSRRKRKPSAAAASSSSSQEQSGSSSSTTEGEPAA